MRKKSLMLMATVAVIMAMLLPSVASATGPSVTANRSFNGTIVTYTGATSNGGPYDEIRVDITLYHNWDYDKIPDDWWPVDSDTDWGSGNGFTASDTFTHVYQGCPNAYKVKAVAYFYYYDDWGNPTVRTDWSTIMFLDY